MNVQHSRRHGEGKYDGKRAACPTNRTVTTETLRQAQGDNFGRAPYKSEAERRAYFVRTTLLELMLRNTSPRGSVYVFTKRTHRFAEIFWVQTPSLEGLVLEMFERIPWVRFPKRTHFWGSNEG